MPKKRRDNDEPNARTGKPDAGVSSRALPSVKAPDDQAGTDAGPGSAPLGFRDARQRARTLRSASRPPTLVPSIVPASASSWPASSWPTAAGSSASERQAVAADPDVGVPQSGANSARAADPLGEFLARYDEHAVTEGASTLGHAEVHREAGSEERRYLAFELAGEVYAASIMDVREILKLTDLTEVPRAHPAVLGVLSKRGVVMPVFDLAAVLGLRAPEPPVALTPPGANAKARPQEQRKRDLRRSQSVLVVADGERVVGLRVDRVQHVVRLALRNTEELPPGVGSRNGNMLVGLGRLRNEAGDVQLIILIDIQEVLFSLAALVTKGGAKALGAQGASRHHA